MMIRLDHIVENPRNSNRMETGAFAKLVTNIKRTKLYPPLLLRAIGNDRYMLIDGAHKRRALLKLGYTEGNCEVWNVSEKEADVMLASIITLRGSEDHRKRAELIDALVGQGLTPETLEHMLPESKSQIEDYQKLMAVDAEVLAAMERIVAEPPPEDPAKMTFTLFPGQFAVVRKALDYLKVAHELEGAKNADGQALEYMAVEYLSGVADEVRAAAEGARETPVGAGAR